MAVFGITTIKAFQYRGGLEEWSNHYHFNGTAPADAAAWATFATQLKTVERALLPPTNDVIAWYGYNPGSEHADYSGTYSSATSGNVSMTGGTQLPGDTAYWIRAETGRLTSKGKKIYLRKYYHPGVCATGTPDQLSAPLATGCAAVLVGLIDGTSTGGAKWCDKDGNIARNGFVGPYITTRTLKRRGKRPG